VPRVIARTSDDIEACGLTLDELQELWLGPGPRGSLFHSREELQDAWVQGRDVVMRLWGQDGGPSSVWNGLASIGSGSTFTRLAYFPKPSRRITKLKGTAAGANGNERPRSRRTSEALTPKA